MEHVRFFTGFPALSELQQFLSSKEDVPFETSELYSSVVDDKIVDEKLRKSRFRAFQDREIFDLVHQTIEWLNESDERFSYQLRRDNITETRYQNGGHFSKHKDFLSLTSNLVEEFTLILCVTPPGFGPVEGGETLIFPYASKDGVPFDTAKPGNGLLFRKDLEHAGNLLKTGEKHILTANIWATRKLASNQVLFVTFPKETMEELAPESAEAHLKQVANQNTSYALPVDCLKGTMLDAHVRFFNQKHEQQGQDPPTIVPYACADFSFDEFGTVAKILLRSYIHENEVRQHADCIEFFGPFRAENLLVNLALEPKGPVDPEASCQRFVLPANADDGDKKLPAKKFKTTGDNVPEELNDMNVIVCENESRAKVVYEVARQLGDDSYVPFKMIFAEGQIATGYYNNVKNIGVTPVALVVGEYNHIFAIQKCGLTSGVDEHTLQEHYAKCNYFANGGTYDIFAGGDDEWNDDDWQQQEDDFMNGGCHCLALKVSIGEESARDKLTRYIFESEMSRSVGPSDFHLLPEILAEMGSDSDEKSAKEDAMGDKEATATNLFHRDDSGKVVFTPEEADSASKYIASMDLDERVKACKYTCSIIHFGSRNIELTWYVFLACLQASRRNVSSFLKSRRQLTNTIAMNIRMRL